MSTPEPELLDLRPSHRDRSVGSELDLGDVALEDVAAALALGLQYRLVAQVPDRVGERIEDAFRGVEARARADVFLEPARDDQDLARRGRARRGGRRAHEAALAGARRRGDG